MACRLLYEVRPGDKIPKGFKVYSGPQKLHVDQGSVQDPLRDLKPKKDRSDNKQTQAPDSEASDWDEVSLAETTELVTLSEGTDKSSIG